MTGWGFAAGICVLLAGTLFWLLRSRRVREKYTAIWVVVVVTVCVAGIVPGLVIWLSGFVGVETPVNLVFATAIVVLLVLCIQLSAEVSNLEEETRTIAEELALLRERVERHETAGRPGRTTHTPPPAGPLRVEVPEPGITIPDDAALRSRPSTPLGS